ncbi:putative 7alpha-cephem-methoxylase P8 chain [Triangularia setosa]|uniref:7alpha-cephem-methoxylase P8 chain n=1 Tax=Triangularia setosa TaxID=2587417 RepID=A0AAN6WDR7_9PEZI|nr:putative 7alpha-cephem-methoxylase P8 chain [Podospora setosa]
MAIDHLPPSGDVTSPLNFYAPPEDGSAPFNLADLPPDSPLPPRNYGSKAVPTLIHDVRPNYQDFTLDNDSFQIISSQPPPSSEPSLFTSSDSIETHYYPEITSLLLSSIPGATKVVLFDHTIRLPPSPSAQRTPVQRVHIDQTPPSAAQRVRRHLPEKEAEEILSNGTRYRIVNVWRPLNDQPLESFPLAFASSASLRDDEVIPVEHRYTQTGYIGQTAAIAHHPDQKWYYLSGMKNTKRILLQCFDSEALKEGSEVKGGRVAHSAFEDPRTRPEAEGRRSIEVRALVFGP